MNFLERIEMPIADTYVNNWDDYMALRELFQNAIDREKEGKFFSWDHIYDEDAQILKIRNKNTSIDLKSLVLGASDKQLKSGMIGKFGEGYKLALIVLLRNGKKINIINGSEIWEPKIEWNDKFKCRIMVIDIYKNDTTGGEDLIYEIGNVQSKFFKSYHKFNLYLQNGYKSKKTSYGEILFDERHQGCIFVEGLYICKLNEDFKYGYNFNADQIPLDRDRMSVSTFDVKWACQRMAREIMVDQKEDIIQMIKGQKKDVEYVFHEIGETKEIQEAVEEVKSNIYESFREKNGLKAVPIVYQSEKEQYESKFSGLEYIIVSQNEKDVIESDERFKADLQRYENQIKRDTPEEIILKFWNDYKSTVFSNSTIFTDDFQVRILEASKNWKNK